MSELNNAIDVLVNTLVDSGAENYNQHIVSGDNGVDYVVTVQVKDGLTPCEKFSAMEQQGEWVSVDDRLPEQDLLVNVSGGDIDGVSVGWYSPLHSKDCATFDVIEDDEFLSMRATHWMLLPTPPKGE